MATGYSSGGVNLSAELSGPLGGYRGGGCLEPAIMAPAAMPAPTAPMAAPEPKPPLPRPVYPPLMSDENPPLPG
jgi:hypothetical protein